MVRYYGPEKRRYKRLAISIPVKYSLGPGGSIHKANTMDISVGGICLGPISLSNEWMLGSCQVELEITLPHLRQPLSVVAEVVRIEESKKPDYVHHRRRHNVRLKFYKISEEDKKTIEGFVNQHFPV